MTSTVELAQSAAVGATVAVTAATATPFETVFNESSLIVAIFGGLGGSARWLFLREGVWEGSRLAVLGALLAFGMGNLWYLVVRTQWGDVPDHILAQPETAYYGAFLIGLGAVTILGRVIDDKDEPDE
jgi:hypothetical protein